MAVVKKGSCPELQNSPLACQSFLPVAFLLGSIDCNMTTTTAAASTPTPTFDPTAPDWLEKGDNAWQLAAASLVALQSIPGLMVLYAGIVRTKWAINSAFMAFYAFASVLICWVLWAYNMGFG